MEGTAVLGSPAETSGGHRYPELTGLRALAAAGVVVIHAAFWTGDLTDTPTGRALGRLDVAVPVFFVLSGFLLSRPFFRAAAGQAGSPGIPGYLWRRAVRVLPVYWITVTLALLVLPANAHARTRPVEWLRELLLVQNYDGRGFADGLAQAWSLSLEIAFYLALPLLVAGLVWLTGRGTWRPGRVLAGLAVFPVVSAVWAGWSVSGGAGLPSANLWLPGYLGWFAPGMAMAVLSVCDRSWRPVQAVTELAAHTGTCWAAAGVVFWVACGPLAGPLALASPTTAEYVTKNVLYAVISGLVVLPLALGPSGQGWLRQVLTSPPMLFLGEVSYGLFLLHMGVLALLHRALTGHHVAGSLLVMGLLGWLGAMVLAVAAHYGVERPLSRWRGLVGRERRTISPAATTATATSVNV